jgi:hypothetical protein
MDELSASFSDLASLLEQVSKVCNKADADARTDMNAFESAPAPGTVRRSLEPRANLPRRLHPVGLSPAAAQLESLASARRARPQPKRSWAWS